MEKELTTTKKNDMDEKVEYVIVEKGEYERLKAIEKQKELDDELYMESLQRQRETLLHGLKLLKYKI